MGASTVRSGHVRGGPRPRPPGPGVRGPGPDRPQQGSRRAGQPQGAAQEGIPLLARQLRRDGQGEVADAHSFLDRYRLAVLVYEDPDLIVLNKAPGVLVHPSHGHFDDTLGNFLMDYYKKPLPGDGVDQLQPRRVEGGTGDQCRV